MKTSSGDKEVKEERNTFFLGSSTSFVSHAPEGPSMLVSIGASDSPENRDIRKTWTKVS